MVVAAPDSDDQKIGILMAGRRSVAFRKLCKDADIDRGACYIASVFRKRPIGGKMHNNFTSWKAEAAPNLFVPYRGELLRKECADDYAKLRDTIHKIRPRVIVAFGEIAAWATAMQSDDDYESLFEQGPIKFGTTIPKKPFFYWVLLTHSIGNAENAADRRQMVKTLKRAAALAAKSVDA